MQVQASLSKAPELVRAGPIAAAKPTDLHIERRHLAAGAIGQHHQADSQTATWPQHRAAPTIDPAVPPDETPLLVFLVFKSAQQNDRDGRHPWTDTPPIQRRATPGSVRQAGPGGHAAPTIAIRWRFMIDV